MSFQIILADDHPLILTGIESLEPPEELDDAVESLVRASLLFPELRELVVVRIVELTRRVVRHVEQRHRGGLGHGREGAGGEGGGGKSLNELAAGGHAFLGGVVEGMADDPDKATDKERMVFWLFMT